MNRIDALKDVRARGEGILSLTLTPNSMWDYVKTFELIDLLIGAGLNQLLNLVYEPQAFRLGVIAPAEVLLLKKGIEENEEYTELLPPPLKHLRGHYPQLPLIITTSIGDIFCYGQKRFLKKCVEIGIDGIDTAGYLATDDPVGFRKAAQDAGIKFICAVFTKSFAFDDPVAMAKVEEMVKVSEGEILLVPAVPGTSKKIHGDYFAPLVAYIREIQGKYNVKSHIISIGGVSTPEDAYQLVKVAGTDGIHSSTAFINRLLSGEPLEKIESWLIEFKDAMKS